MEFSNEVIELLSRLYDIEDDRDCFDQDLCRVAEMSCSEYEKFLISRAETEYGQIWACFREVMFVASHWYAHPATETEARSAFRNSISGTSLDLEILKLIEEQIFLVPCRGLEFAKGLWVMLSILDSNWTAQESTLTMNNLYWSCVQSFEQDKSKNIIVEVSLISSSWFSNDLDNFSPTDFNTWD